MRSEVAPQFRKTSETFTPGAKTLPQPYFVAPEVFAREQKEIFAKEWVLVGHQSQLTRPGAYFLAQFAGESVIVVLDQRSTVHAFYNVCRHRGTRLCEKQT